MAGTAFKGSKKATVAAVKPSASPTGAVPGFPGKSVPAKKIAGPGKGGKK